MDINKIIVIGNDAYCEFKNLFGINKENISLSNFVLTNNFNLGKKNIEVESLLKCLLKCLLKSDFNKQIKIAKGAVFWLEVKEKDYFVVIINRDD